MSPVVTLAISMHVRCKACESSIHIGAIVDRARCPKCGAIEQLSPARWRGFLDHAVNDGPGLAHEEAQIVFDEDEAWVIAQSHVPKCASCNQVFPKTAAENARKHGRCFCVACGAKVGVRPVPPAFAEALPCITHLLGEDGGQIKNPEAQIPDASQAISLRCPDCGGNIQPDGKSRGVRCPYCSVLVVLPQAIWKRFAGKNEPHVFYLVHDPSLPRPLGRADVQWSSLDGLVADAYGNLYGIGTDGVGIGHSDNRVVFALDRQLKTKWINKSIGIDDDGHIAWRNDGVLFAWSPRRYSAVLLRAADGRELGKLGGQQAAGADRHMLDLSQAESLALDIDGTILFSKHDRLVRCAPDGSAQFTWPPGQGLLGGVFGEKLRPFTKDSEEGAEWLENVGDRPTKLHDVAIRIGWDGITYLQRSERLSAYDRMGKKLFGLELDRDKHGYVKDFGADARGVLYILCGTESYCSSIHRVIGGKVTPFIDGRHPQTPIREERELAVHPDGTLAVAAGSRELRLFAADGRLLYRSADAIEEDERYAKQKAEEQRGDKVR